jgi:hypothetical protein
VIFVCLVWKANYISSEKQTPSLQNIKLNCRTHYLKKNYAGILFFLDLDWCTSSRWRCRRNLLWCGCGGNGDNIGSSQECIQMCKLWKESLKYTITFSIITGTTILILGEEFVCSLSKFNRNKTIDPKCAKINNGTLQFSTWKCAKSLREITDFWIGEILVYLTDGNTCSKLLFTLDVRHVV